MEKLIPTTLNIGVESILKSVLNLLNVNVSETAIKEKINSHPNYPSLLSLAETLEIWKIDSLALKTTIQKLPSLPLPFVAHTFSTLKPFILIKELNASKITYIDDERKTHTVTLEQFSKIWDGYVLAVESNENSGEKDYAINARKEQWNQVKIPLIVISLSLITLLNILLARTATGNSVANFYTLFTWAISFFGMCITIFLLWHEYDHDNTTINKICTFSLETDCNAILASGASKLFNVATWSEIGFTYFTGSVLFLSINIHQPNVLQPLILLSISALPYICFSLYYQAFVAKQWCVLCLLVQSVLGLNILVSFLTNRINASIFENLTSIDYPALLLSYFIPIAVWVLLKRYIYTNKELVLKSYSLNRFKSNIDIFESFLSKQEPVKNDPGNIGILIGNANAENTIIKVCNPYCGPCAKVHPKIEDLLKRSGNWKVRIIFTATANESDLKYLPTAHLMSIYKSGDDGQLRKSLDDWYTQDIKNYEKFAKQYPAKSLLNEQNEDIDLMHKWCEDEGIEFTPTIYVNGYRLPDEYSIEDLSYI